LKTLHYLQPVENAVLGSN